MDKRIAIVAALAAAWLLTRPRQPKRTWQEAKTILVFGDSQTQGIGRRLARKLKTGRTVTQSENPGKQTNQLLEIARRKFRRPSFDHVFIFGGGNDASAGRNRTDQAAELARHFGTSRVTWIGPPPATRITDLARARRVFGRKVTDDQYMTRTYGARRDSYSRKLKAAVEGAGAQYLDPRNAFASFPAQPDGIHVSGASADAVARWIVGIQ